MNDSEDLNPPWLPAAEAVLQSAIEGDLTKVAGTIEDAVEEHGVDVMGGFALAWIDALRQRIGVPIGATVHTHHICADTDQETRTPPAGVVWAGRLITARIARDQAAYEAVFREGGEGQGWAGNLVSLLLVVARTIDVAARQPVVRRRGAAFGVRPHAAHSHGLGDVRPPV